MYAKQRGKTTVHILLTIVVLVIILVQAIFMKDLTPLEDAGVIQSIAQQFRIKTSFLVFVINIAINFVEYAILGASLVLSMHDIKKQLMIGLPFCIGIIYAGVVERCRQHIHGLSFSTSDMVVCLLGLLIGIVICWTVRRESTE